MLLGEATGALGLGSNPTATAIGYESKKYDVFVLDKNKFCSEVHIVLKK